MTKRRLLVRIFLLPALLAFAVAEAAPRIVPGSGSFEYVDAKGDASKKMTVYTYLPPGISAVNARIVFALHGSGKNARSMRDTWVEHADRYGFMVIAPRFDAEQWGQGAYSYASVIDRGGRRHDPSQWSYTVIEHLFDDVKRATGNRAPSYYLYGHSEGAQFVHRLVSLLPDARYARAVAANAGWYIMPTFEVNYPHGLNDAPLSRDALKKVLGRDFVVLLGDRDIDPNHPGLSKSRQAREQGAHRLERGRNYFALAKERAVELQCPFGWQLQVVPFAAHENSKMARAAAVVLMGR